MAKLAVSFLNVPPRLKRRVGGGSGVLHVSLVKKIPAKGKRDLEAIKALRFGPGRGIFPYDNCVQSGSEPVDDSRIG